MDLDEDIEARLRELASAYEEEMKQNGYSDNLCAIEMQMIEATEGLYEHPDWFEYPCFCDTCRYYD